jgi:hypothetical protein
MTTKVIFRKFPDGEIIALFPEIVADCFLGNCLSYMHIGQHSVASTGLIAVTMLASPEEYTDLKRELESIGYDLHICKRQSYRMFQTRLIKFKRIIK